jgi:U2 small nuclear ribonucleoprotein A'
VLIYIYTYHSINMVYLTIETLKNARGFVNPCKKRELDLRDLSLDTIENLGLTLDQYDVIDVSGNYLKRLENFPTLQRLECITAHNNSIATIDSDMFSRCLPSLRTLLLTNNNISDINEVKGLNKCETLQHLSLLGNPVTGISNYRLFVITALPFLKTLDYKKVTQTEKEAAANGFDSTVATNYNNNNNKINSNNNMEVDEKPSQNNNNSDKNNEKNKNELKAKKKTIDKDLLQRAIGMANTPEILAALEKALKNGTFNEDFVNSIGGNNDNNNNNNNDGDTRNNKTATPNNNIELNRSKEKKEEETKKVEENAPMQKAEEKENPKEVAKESMQPDDNMEEAEMEEEEEEEVLTKAILMKMKKDTLIGLAKKYNVSETGTKKVLSNNIFNAYESKQKGNGKSKRKRSDSNVSNSSTGSKKKARR